MTEGRGGHREVAALVLRRCRMIANLYYFCMFLFGGLTALAVFHDL